MRASSICLALFPTISVTTELNLIVVVSRILWMRLLCRFRSCISWVWVRTRSRSSRIGLGGIKLAGSQTVAQEISNPLAILNLCGIDFECSRFLLAARPVLVSPSRGNSSCLDVASARDQSPSRFSQHQHIKYERLFLKVFLFELEFERPGARIVG